MKGTKKKYNRFISLIWANVNIPSPTIEIKTTEVMTLQPTEFFFTTISSVERARRSKQIHFPAIDDSSRIFDNFFFTFESGYFIIFLNIFLLVFFLFSFSLSLPNEPKDKKQAGKLHIRERHEEFFRQGCICCSVRREFWVLCRWSSEWRPFASWPRGLVAVPDGELWPPVGEQGTRCLKSWNRSPGRTARSPTHHSKKKTKKR